MNQDFSTPNNEQIRSPQDIIEALRTAHQHQVQLNLVADQKANINIGFTLFFMTLGQSQISLTVGEDALIRAGFILLVLTITTSLLLALAVVLPRTGKIRIDKPEQMSNPFFFGLFSQLKQDEYVDYLTTQFDDSNNARRLIAVDIYQIGQVLNHKYRLLRFSYSFLAFSILVAVMVYCYKMLIA